MRQRFGTRIAAVAAALLALAAVIAPGSPSPASAAQPAVSTASSAPTPASSAAEVSAAAVGPVRTDVNDFVFESFDVEYELGRDEEGRSVLRTREHIVALFPEFDQNRGIIRSIPRVYDGHSTELELVSVADELGSPRPYTSEDDGDFRALTIAVPEGQFVHGPQHYVIEYTQRDVTRHFEDTGADEFYWDVNGTDWRQPFQRVGAELLLSDGLADALDGNASCYLGALGSDEQCTIEQREDRGFSVLESDLGPGENVSIAIGFEPGTFASAPVPPTPFLQQVPLLIWGGVASLIAAIATFVTALVRGRGASTGRAIIAQYEPPEGVSAAVSAELLRKRGKAMTASLLDLAVRRKLRLLHHEPTDQYGAQALDGSGLDRIETRLYNSVFSGSPAPTEIAPGTTHWFTRTSTRLGDANAALRREATAEVKTRGLVKKPSGAAIGVVIGLMLLALALPLLHSIVFGQFTFMTILLAVGINALIWITLGMVWALAARRSPTREGILLIEHLQGLREYIRLAEADRIRMLQSASGAEVDERFIVRVYERLLPYAVLFGFENEWQAELAGYYRESTPDWVAGSESSSVSFMHVLPIAGFAHAVTTSPATQPVSSSSGSGSGGSFSSFSGGSSGGGFSGGGGGGGGGGGV